MNPGCKSVLWHCHVVMSGISLSQCPGRFPSSGHCIVWVSLWLWLYVGGSPIRFSPKLGPALGLLLGVLGEYRNRPDCIGLPAASAPVSCSPLRTHTSLQMSIYTFLLSHQLLRASWNLSFCFPLLELCFKQNDFLASHITNRWNFNRGFEKQVKIEFIRTQALESGCLAFCHDAWLFLLCHIRQLTSLYFSFVIFEIREVTDLAP